MQLRIAGLTFEGGLGDGPFTLEWMTGWRADGADMRRERVARPGAHGFYSGDGFLGERDISWGGLILSGSVPEQEHSMRRLSGLLAAGVAGRLVGDNGDAVWVDVKRGDAPQMTVVVPGRVASYRFNVVAPNPRLFGEVRDFAAGVPAVQYGNFPATPRLMVGAGSGGYTVTGPGARTVVVVTAPSAAHYIDFVSGGLYTAAGVRQVGAITTYRPWDIPVGAPGVAASISGSRSLIQRVTDTYI